MQAQPEWAIQLQAALECYNFAAKSDNEDKDEDEDPRNTNIPKSEGTRDVEGPQLEIPAITEPIKIKKSILAQTQNLSLPLLETIGTMKQSDRLQICYMTIVTYFPPSSQR